MPRKEETDVPPERLENAERVFDDFIGLKPEENVLLLTDRDFFNTDPELIETIKEGLKKRGNEVTVMIADDNTAQEEVLKAVREHNVIWGSWGMDDTEVNFDAMIEEMEKAGSRMAWCPGIRATALDNDGALAEKREVLDERLGRMEEKLRDVQGFHIRTSYGTDLQMGMLGKEERRWFKANGVITPGRWDNLPGGEIFTTPDEKDVNGVLVLPVLQDEVTQEQGVDEFVRLTIRGGKIAKIDGGKSAEELRVYIEEHSREEMEDPTGVLQCAEIAFGANAKARTVPTNPEGYYTEPGAPTTETEKRLGTMHIAFGSTKHGEEGTEGHTETESSLHLDFVIPRHGLTVTAFKTKEDFRKEKKGKKLIDEGRWNFL